MLTVGVGSKTTQPPPVVMPSEPAKEALWLTNYEKAQKQAKESNRLLLLEFTGSDWCGWCGWCIKLTREVFSKPEFKSHAEKNPVLLKVDFPRGKRLSDQERVQNEQLAMEFGIQGFPTLGVLDSGGADARTTRLRRGDPGRRPGAEGFAGGVYRHGRKAPQALGFCSLGKHRKDSKRLAVSSRACGFAETNATTAGF